MTMPRTLLLSSIIWIAGSYAAWSQPLNQCEASIRRYEAAHGIPNKLLTAISLVESGRKVKGTFVSWPWTINANGTPYVFDSKQEAITMVRKLQRKGIRSIDVGCMQVNLKQHPGAFSSLEAAFDPETNIAYAAKFLKAKKEDKGSWGHAVAHYHSATPKFHTPYKARVFKTWTKVQNGRFNYPELLLQETSSLNTFLNDLERHKGQFVKKISTGNGRHVPLLVRFAPYKGVQKGLHRTKHVSKKALKQDIPPVIFIDGKLKTVGKVIINKMVMQGQQERPSADVNSLAGKIITISTKQDGGIKKKVKRTNVAKFRAKTQSRK
jgi:hypothetical protein